MKVALTHEQADFDALASLLGVYLLNENVIPALPRRMNRNVNAFVTLYGAELPFVEPGDLPSEPIDFLYLVDTQSMVTLKGLTPETRVYVVDHHPLRGDTPPGWTITTEEIGATTTLLVEQLRQCDRSFSMIQATLLVLGIYEDTGSLTYSQTTARDLQSASFLLEQGASLRIAADFLNHPLSPEQGRLYDLLRANAESYSMHGYSIIITRGNAQELEEELSTIAHKLRDLLDPDALFLLVKTRAGVQMIARSTTDNIDVAEISAHFGGGGHARAAAGLIKNVQVDEVYTELIKILPGYIRPAITAAHLMSRNPQVLPPEMKAREVAERMRRFGYEGFPVVQDGKVIGLITRRAVDRALSHKMDLNTARLMTAGSVIVHPEDSIDHIQRLMADTGWGQIPVVNPADGAIIGIVTRTDLLKMLIAQSLRPKQLDLVIRLEKALPPQHLALLKLMAEAATQAHTALYIVGGFVRDLILERPGLDFDLVVEGDAISLAEKLRNQFGGKLTAHGQFGTAKWFIDIGEARLSRILPIGLESAHLPEFIDLISARTEFYTYPTALPTVERGSIKLDLHRRDFTINTLALRLDGSHYGELHDYWGGLSDLEGKLVRVLHSLSFVDDPTRMLRAVRFEGRFGFNIEARTLELLKEALSLFGRISGDRIRHELDHILDEQNCLVMLDRLSELDLLTAIHPALPWNHGIKSRLEKLASFTFPAAWEAPASISREPFRRALAYALWLLDIPAEALPGLFSRLQFPRSLADDLQAASRQWAVLPTLIGQPASRITKRLDEYPVFASYVCFIATDHPNLTEYLHRYLTEWRKTMPFSSGDDLKALGLPPGPAYRRILQQLRVARLDGWVSTIAEEQKLLEELLQEQTRKS
jgi:tRNA nucleotidyltransferase (CCA-adding enzyme)